jgi:geranylgeranyl pyrophosphate synthase
MDNELARFLEGVRAEVDADLARRLAIGPDDPGRLREAMAYAVLGGGKRLRPAIALAAAEAVAGPEGRQMALPAASAVEMLHAYTLVHDDLPAMDDDDERRGRPTVHIAFGEATAILAGDGLLTAAFGTLAELGPRATDAVRILAARAGARGLLSGQCRDLEVEAGKPPKTLADLEMIHIEKTGALFAAAAELGGLAAGAGTDQRKRLSDFGLAYGVAFQHADDLDDGDQPEFAAAARPRIAELVTQARNALSPFISRAGMLEKILATVSVL